MDLNRRKWDCEKFAASFEQEDAAKFVEYRFTVHPNVRVTKRLGEIDAIPYHPETKIAVLVECKALKLKLDWSSSIDQIEEFLG